MVDTPFLRGAAFVTPSPLSVVELHGDDGRAVLNNLCTADLRPLEAGWGREAFFTEARGRTLGHGIVYALEDRLLLVGTGAQTPRLVDHIDRYIIREDARPVDVTAGSVGFLVSGRTGREAIERIASLPVGTLPEMAIGEVSLGGARVYAAAVPWTSDEDRLLVASSGDQPAVIEHLEGLGLQRAEDADFQRARIENGWPWYGEDVTEKNLPQELDRNRRAISFTKGCYLGQETVARLDALGQVQRKLVGWRIEGEAPPEPGAELRDGERVVGTITSSAAAAEQNATLALGFARRTHFAAGSRALVEGRAAETVALPMSG